MDTTLKVVNVNDNLETQRPGCHEDKMNTCYDVMNV